MLRRSDAFRIALTASTEMNHSQPRSTASTPPSSSPAAVFSRAGESWQPSELARGPWDPRSQHGGAPAALVVHLAESAMPEAGWQLTRLTLELVKPAPLTRLATRIASASARSTTRLTIDLLAGESLVARAHALMLRTQDLHLPADMQGWSPAALTPPPADCKQRAHIAGLPNDGVHFHNRALESFVAHGDTSRAGPAAAWFRLLVPVVDDAPNSPAMRVAAAADFGNGLSWVLPAERYLFSNADLSVHLFRMPVGEWVGVEAQTQMDGSGAGTTHSRLYDEQGAIGVAIQSLVLRERPSPA
jgi:hypothetical protein